MANIQARKNKNGKIISYSIRVYKGRDPYSGKQLKPYTATWTVPCGWSEKRAEKEARKQAVLFEKECKDGNLSDSNRTFTQFANYVIDTKVRAGILKPRTEYHYRELLVRTNESIGHIMLKDIRPLHINQFYERLSKIKTGHDAEKAVAKTYLTAFMKEQCLSILDVSRKKNITLHYSTVYRACRGHKVTAKSAVEISNGLGISPTKIFSFITDDASLSNRTIRDYHQFVSSILSEAEREMLIPYNPASRARPPKIGESSPNYLQIDDVKRIVETLKQEHIKWRTMIHLFLVTGARLSEIIALKWQSVDKQGRQILIDRALLYTPKDGLYEGTPKTKNSVRSISIPNETMYLLQEYRIWQTEQKLLLGDKWENSEYVFTNKQGGGLNPGTVGNWLRQFSVKHDLPHLNAHAFRHTLASILFFAGADAISISKRLGHARVSTTTDIYSHILKESESTLSDYMTDVIYSS